MAVGYFLHRTIQQEYQEFQILQMVDYLLLHRSIQQELQVQIQMILQMMILLQQVQLEHQGIHALAGLKLC